MSLWTTPQSALQTFGFRDHIATAPAAWPVIKLDGSRITSIGLAIWGCYLGGHLKAVDVVSLAEDPKVEATHEVEHVGTRNEPQEPKKETPA